MDLCSTGWKLLRYHSPLHEYLGHFEVLLIMGRHTFPFANLTSVVCEDVHKRRLELQHCPSGHAQQVRTARNRQSCQDPSVDMVYTALHSQYYLAYLEAIETRYLCYLNAEAGDGQ